jgi:hypothetical protein
MEEWRKGNVGVGRMAAEDNPAEEKLINRTVHQEGKGWLHLEATQR